jgi:uncharacterized protein DUF4920
MKWIAVMALALAFVAAPVDDTKLGAGVTLEQATPIAAIVKTPADFVGKTVRVDGVATAVCEMMGCWMAVAESDAKDAPVVRLKVEHDGAIVFPVSAKGKQVSAQGVFEAVAAEGEAHDAAMEHMAHDAKATAQYQIKATGAIIR